MDALNLLALDFGASGGRAVLGRFDGSRLTAQTIHRFPNGPIERDGHLHWDASALLEEMKRGIGLAAAAAGGKLASIGIDTWGVDYGLLDAAGELLEDPYHYRDKRTEAMMASAFTKMPKAELFRRTGIAFHPFNTLYQLLAAQRQVPSALDQAACILMMPDLLAYFLTGVKATEYTIASTSQLIDPSGRSWHGEILAAFDLPPRIFTDIQEPGSIRGTIRRELGEELAAGEAKVVAVAGHDTASAVIPASGAAGGGAYLSSGTWSLLGVEVDSPAIGRQAMDRNFTNEGGVDGTVRLLRNIAGLWLLQECKRQWDAGGGTEDFAALAELAAQAEPFGSLVDPDAETFAGPGDMVGKIRCFCRRTGQPAPDDKGPVVRCILESLALKCRWAVEELEGLVGRSIRRLHIVGGGSRNMLLNEFAASSLNRPVICGPAEATAIGNLMMQARGLGRIGGLDEIREVTDLSFPQRLIAPQQPERWNQAYQRYLRLL